MSTTLIMPSSMPPIAPKPATARAPSPVGRNVVSVKRYVFAGFATIIALFGGIGGWAAFTDMAGAVLAPGTVVVAGNIKKVQHPTGGVINEILVRNGDAVKAGDILVRLDETVTRASLQLITKQIDELHGRLARLIGRCSQLDGQGGGSRALTCGDRERDAGGRRARRPSDLSACAGRHFAQPITAPVPSGKRCSRP